MITSRKLLTYLLQALIHKERTPLATIQNDMEYLASICKNDETNEINTSVKNSISKINNILDNAIFVMNNQDDKKEETFLISDLKTINTLILNDNDYPNEKITTNKNDLFNYFKLLASSLSSLHLLSSSKDKLLLNVNKEGNSLLLTSSFKTIETNSFETEKNFNLLCEYINIKNNIDSIDSLLSDILLIDLGLSLNLKANKDYIFLTIKGFNV
ncbi:MAG: hypothetical protein SPJ04_04650 [Bdellovibrionota bacterium]|nr:hypothetical protein [Pseudomonadota bacterium]MDY6090526.1 hypothetical protein [Bdellovibrionota bacterium]